MFLLPRGGLDVDLLPGKPPVGRLEVEARFRDWGSRGKSGIHVRANVRGIFQLPLHAEDVLARAAHELALTAEHHVVEPGKALVFRQRTQRPEERRVGKTWVRKCRARGAPDY